MTPEEYRKHKAPALRRAFFRGELAGASGIPLGSNPYREVRVTKKARRGSWSEAFSTAWAVGWRHAHRTSSPAEVADAIAEQGERA